MAQTMRDFLCAPPDLLEELRRDAVQKNRLALLAICLMIFGMELYNMARVLFWSSSGLGTLNNRIYFGMYAVLFGAAALCLLLQRGFRRASPRALLAVQLGSAFFFLIWHVCLNIYDLMRDPAAQTGIFTTAVLALSVFLQLPAWYALLSYAAAWLLFMALAGPILPEGDQLNLTITVIVSLVLSLIHRRQTVLFLSQQRALREANARLQVLLEKDALTGLLNRAALQAETIRHLEALEAPGAVAFLMVDLDDFKSINDRHGHPCGDYVLQETALRLRAVFGPEAGVGRIGGDEFAVVLSSPEGPVDLTAGCRRFLRSAESITWHGAGLGVSYSIGACQAARPGLSYEVLYQEADQALYEAKRGGKHCMRLHLLPEEEPPLWS